MKQGCRTPNQSSQMFSLQETLCFFKRSLPFCRNLSICRKDALQHMFGKSTPYGGVIYWDAFCSKYSISETPLYVACASPHCKRVEEQKNTFMNWALDHKFRICSHMSQYLLGTALITPLV